MGSPILATKGTTGAEALKGMVANIGEIRNASFAWAKAVQQKKINEATTESMNVVADAAALAMKAPAEELLPFF